MPRQWRQFARVAAFVERKQNDRKVCFIPETVEQRLQRLDVVGPRRDIGALVAPEAFEQLAVVIAQAPRMDLHDQPVIDTHRRHFCEHLRAEKFGIRAASRSRLYAVEQRLCFCGRKIGGRGGRVAVIARGRPHFGEKAAPLAMRGKIARPGHRVLTRQLAKLCQIVHEPLELGIDDGVWAIGGDDAAVPVAGSDSGMVLERVERAFGRCEDFYPVAIEQRSGAELGSLQLLGDGIEIKVGGACIEPHIEPECLGKDPVEPCSRGGGAEQVIILREYPPRGTWIRVTSGNTQILESDSLRIEHAEDVMIGVE